MIKPLHDNVLLEVVEAETKTASGILLSSNTKEEPSIARVLSVGDGKMEDGKLIPSQLKPKDKVIYKKYSTTEVKFDDKEYLLIKEADILAVIE